MTAFIYSGMDLSNPTQNSLSKLFHLSLMSVDRSLIYGTFSLNIFEKCQYECSTGFLYKLFASHRIDYAIPEKKS